MLLKITKVLKDKASATLSNFFQMPIEYTTLYSQKQDKKKGADFLNRLPFYLTYTYRLQLIVAFYFLFRNIAFFKTFNFFNAIQPILCFSAIGKGADPYTMR